MTPADSFEIILGLLAVVVVLELAARRLGLPPCAVMVLGGVGLALTPGVPELRLDPDLILVLFLPPLLFSGAYFTVWRDFRANLGIIVQLAVGAVGFSTLVVGVVTHLLVPGLPWAACFTLGAIVSPPDAVAAKVVLQGLPLPPRLITRWRVRAWSMTPRDWCCSVLQSQRASRALSASGPPHGSSASSPSAASCSVSLSVGSQYSCSDASGAAAQHCRRVSDGLGLLHSGRSSACLRRARDRRSRSRARQAPARAFWRPDPHSGSRSLVGRRVHPQFPGLHPDRACAAGHSATPAASRLDTGAMGLAIAGVILALIAARFASIGLSAYVVRFLFPPCGAAIRIRRLPF